MQILTNASAVLTETSSVFYTSPTDTTSAVHTIFFSTIETDESSFITIEVYDASEGRLIQVAKNIEVVPNATFTFDRPIYLDQNDQIKVYSTRPGVVHAFASIMKIVPLSI